MAAAKKEKVADPRKAAFRVRAGRLKAALGDVAQVVEGRNTIPVLECVLIEAGDGAIRLTASNLDMWAARVLASDDRDGPASKDWLAAIKPLAICLPARTLLAVLGELDADAMVTLELDQMKVIVSAGRARFRLPFLPADDFPVPRLFDGAASFEMPCTALADSFARVEHAISTEEARYYLNGVYLHPDTEALTLRLAATDGSRLARLTIAAPDGALAFPAVIIARQTVQVLDKLLASAVRAQDANVTATVLVETSGAAQGGAKEGAKGVLRFTMPASDQGEVVVTAKPIDGEFPAYDRVVPSACDKLATVNRETLIAAVKRVCVLGDAKSRAVKAVFGPDKLTLSVVSPDLGEASEDLPCAYAGAETTIGFNGKYWQQLLGAIADDEVAIAFNDSCGPVLMQAGGAGLLPGLFAQVMMPMRV